MKKIVVLILCMSLMLVGCGSGADNEATSGGSVKQAQGIFEDKIVVGTTGAQQGPLAFIGKPYFDGMKAYFNMLNDDHGGVNGKKIELSVLEDEFKPENSIANVQRLINDDQVFALVGLFGTPGVKAAIPTVKDAGIPAVYFATGAHAPTQAGENFFPVQPNYVYEGKLMSKYIRDYFKAEKVAVIYRSDDVGLDGVAGLTEGFKTQGMEGAIVDLLSFDAGASDFTAQVAKAKDSGADVIVCYALGGGVSGVIKEMEKMGMVDTPVICPYPNVSDSFVAANLEAAPKVIENLFGLGWVDVKRPAVKDLEEAMAKYFPESPLNAYTISGWIAAETFVKGLEIELEKYPNELTWENYIKSMETLEYTDGIIPRIAYAKNQRQGVVNMALVEVEGNTWVNRTEYEMFDK